MSGEPKTLTPEPATLQGLIVTLGVHGYSLAFQEGRWWAVPPQDAPYEWSDGDTPWEAASKALGVPVVERDEAAELIAQLAECYRETGAAYHPDVPDQELAARAVEEVRQLREHEEEAHGTVSELEAVNKKLRAWIDELALAPAARDEAGELRAAAQAFVDKYFQPGSKADRPDYSLMVTAADVYALREALRLAGGESER